MLLWWRIVRHESIKCYEDQTGNSKMQSIETWRNLKTANKKVQGLLAVG